jgi:beta-glucosidase
MRRVFLTVTGIFIGLLSVSCARKMNIEAEAEAEVEQLISQMTLDEKADMLSGTGFDSKPLPRLGIPAMRMTDGPLGVRNEKATAFPSGIALAAIWNPDLASEMGKAIAREAKGKKLNVVLGPCVNIHRVPMGGRNFESYGEDPYLTGHLAVSYIKGMQSENVIATVKHFAVNNQETERRTINANADERTLREIYFPAFRAAVQEGGVWAVMGAYNRLNGPYCCANPRLLETVLKEDWGFKGLVMSDWGAVHDVDSTLNGGLDLEMPGGDFLTKDNVLASLKAGHVDEKTIDEKVRRMLRVMLTAGLFDSTKQDKGSIDTVAHRALARRIAEEGAVLLKNTGSLLPLDRSAIKSIAVLGPNAKVARTGGGGSSLVAAYDSISPLEGLRKKLGKNTVIHFAGGIPGDIELNPIEYARLVPPNAKPGEEGLLGEYFNNESFKGKPVLTRVDRGVKFDWGDRAPDPAVHPDHFSVRWTGWLVPEKTGFYYLGVGSDDGSRLYLNGKLLVNNWGQHAIEYKSAQVELTAGTRYPVKIEMYEAAGGSGAILAWSFKSAMELGPLEAAVDAAKKSDAAVVFVGSTERSESEGFDRPNCALPEEQIVLIKAVAAVNSRTIVVMNSGAAVLMNEWIDLVPSLVEAWFPGQEAGDAIADLLFGDANPSGKLPTTFLKKWEDCPAYGNFPGEKSNVYYKEGIFVGYRYYDTRNVEPLFPFGYGLSYTTFEYSGLKITPEKMKEDGKVLVKLSIKNTGKVAGGETVQLYLNDDQASVERPAKELKAFQKVFLRPGHKKTVSWNLDKSALSFYDVGKKGWIAESGKFNVLIGSSSRDIRLKGAFELE